MQRAVIVVCDSLRPDLVTPATAPVLAGLAARGTVWAGMRAVFPSVTRTSAASLATGCHPARHRLLGNTMAIDEGEGLVCLSVGPPDFRDRLRRATGRTLHRPTLAEILRRHGGAVVYSNVSPGAAYFHDPDGHGHVFHRAGSFGPGLAALPALPVTLGAAGDAAMTEAFCTEIAERRAPLALLWLSEPDHTGHHTPLGSPAHRAAIAAADACVGRVVATAAALERRGEEVLLVVCSDHGMETATRLIDAEALLVAAGLKETIASRDVVVAPNGSAALLYVAPAARGRIPDLVRWLAAQDWVAQCHAGDGLAALGLPADGDVAAAVALRGDDGANEHGVIGRSDVVVNRIDPKDCRGFGQHGGLGARETRAFLAMLGGGFAPGRRRQEAAIVDIAPTVLRHLGIAGPAMDGRALQ